MILGLESIKQDLNKIQQNLNEIEQLVPAQPIEDEINEELPVNNPRIKEDLRYIIKAYKYLKKLGYIKTQYQFSEEFLHKNKYYYGLILCEARQPSIDSLHNLIKNISNLNDGFNKLRYLDDLYEEGQNLLTKRLLKYL